MKFKYTIAALLTGFAFAAHAADMPMLKAAPAAPSCTVTSCSGWYIGAHLDGMGTNADILGSGLGGSIFADGGALGVQGGYQLWNGNFFAAIEVGGSYYIPASGQPIGISSRFTGTEFVKLGYGLSGLFGAAAPTPSQGPVPVFNTLQANLISPYILFGGDTRSWGTGWAGGAGAEYTLGGGYNLFAEYFHASFNKTTDGAVVNADNVVRLGVNRKF